MAPHSSTLAWKIPWTEEPGRLQSMGSLRVGHDWATSLSLFLSCIGEGNGNPLQCSCLENPMDREVWQATVHRVTKSQTQLKRLSMIHLVTKPPPPCRLQRQLQWSSCFLSLFNSFCYQVCFEVGRSCVPYHIALIIYLANIVPNHGLKLPIKQSFIFF